MNAHDTSAGSRTAKSLPTWALALFGCGGCSLLITLAVLAGLLIAGWGAFSAGHTGAFSVSASDGGSEGGSRAAQTPPKNAADQIATTPQWQKFTPNDSNPLETDGDDTTSGNLIPDAVAAREEPDNYRGVLPDSASDRFRNQWSTAARSDLGILQFGSEPSHCDVAPLVTMTPSGPELEKYSRGLVGCLEQRWQGPLKAEGWQLDPVTISVVKRNEEVPTDCLDEGADPSGDPFENTLSFFCPSNDTIYIPESLPSLAGDPLDPHFTHVNIMQVLAHEYAHHVQWQMGVLGAQWSIYGEADMGEALSAMRRTELQAECLGQITSSGFDGNLALLQSDYDLNTDPNYYEDEPEHGRATTGAFWVQRAYLSHGDARFCNAWIEPSDAVR